MYPEELTYRYYDDKEEENNIQYAGYPITRFIEKNMNMIGGNDKNIGISRLEGLTVPIGLYTYGYSREVYKTPKEEIEIEVIEEPKFQNLLQNVSYRVPSEKKRITKRNIPNKKENKKKASKKKTK